MFDQQRRRLGGRMGRKGQGILYCVMGALLAVPELLRGGGTSTLRIVGGAAFVLLGVYAMATARRSKNEPL